jgi:hypothetical protein
MRLRLILGFAAVIPLVAVGYSTGCAGGVEPIGGGGGTTTEDTTMSDATTGAGGMGGGGTSSSSGSSSSASSSSASSSSVSSSSASSSSASSSSSGVGGGSGIDLSANLYLSGSTLANVAPPLSQVTIAGNPPPGNWVEKVPSDPALYNELTLTGLHAKYLGALPAFTIRVDAGADFGQVVHVELAYDFDGDSADDRTEIYKFFPLDASAGWESYKQTQGLGPQTGALADFNGGTLTVRIWKAFQPNASSMARYQEGTSYVLLPYATVP